MKPRLLDLFCGAGGCTKGYQRAGFYVVGVDIDPQPNYCGDEFIQADALALLYGFGQRWCGYPQLSDFDAVHASPPCQQYSRALKHLAAPKPMLIEPVREALQASALPWVIENVEGAPLPRQDTLDGSYGLELCGTMFDSRVYRHRLFEMSFPVSPPRGCLHSSPAMNPHNQAGRDRIYEEFGRQDPEVIWRFEMGVPWMNKHEGRESVPPGYTEHIGSYLMAHIKQKAAA